MFTPWAMGNLIIAFTDIILGQSDSQVLAAILNNTEKLAKNSMEQGIRHLEIAQRGKDEATRLQYFNDARRAFVEAETVTRDSLLDNAKAKFLLAISFHFLHQIEEALIWYRDSFDTACKRQDALLVEIQKYRKWADTNESWGLIGALMIVPTALGEIAAGRFDKVFRELFELEKLILLLQALLTTWKIQIKKIQNLFYPANAFRIQKASIWMDKSQFAWGLLVSTEDGQIRLVIDARTGKEINIDKIKNGRLRDGETVQTQGEGLL